MFADDQTRVVVVDLQVDVRGRTEIGLKGALLTYLFLRFSVQIHEEHLEQVHRVRRDNATCAWLRVCFEELLCEVLVHGSQSRHMVQDGHRRTAAADSRRRPEERHSP